MPVEKDQERCHEGRECPLTHNGKAQLERKRRIQEQNPEKKGEGVKTYQPTSHPFTSCTSFNSTELRLLYFKTYIKIAILFKMVNVITFDKLGIILDADEVGWGGS